MTDQEKNICRELALLHLKALGADMAKPSVREVVEMIHPAWKFRQDMEKITKTPLDRVLDSLPNGGKAGARAKSFIEHRGIRNVESLVRLRETDITSDFGFGSETVSALQYALEKNNLQFEMLFPTPLHGNGPD